MTITSKNEILLTPQFKMFIRDSKTGKRVTAAGKKISKGAVEQYQIGETTYFNPTFQGALTP